MQVCSVPSNTEGLHPFLLSVRAFFYTDVILLESRGIVEVNIVAAVFNNRRRQKKKFKEQ